MTAHSLKSVTTIKCLEAKSLLKMSHPVTFCEVDAQSVFGSADQPDLLLHCVVWGSKSKCKNLCLGI